VDLRPVRPVSRTLGRQWSRDQEDSDQADPDARFGPVTGPAQRIAVQPESPGQPRDPTRLASYSAHRVTTSEGAPAKPG
jgi:hypothetical protein